MPNYHDSDTHSLTHLAALNAITARVGDIGSAQAELLLRNLKAAVFHGVPIVAVTDKDLAAAIAAPPEKEETE